jgi:tight adherence protein C
MIMILFPFGEQQETVQNRIMSISNMDQRDVLIDDDLKKPFNERLIKPLLLKIRQQTKKMIPDARDYEPGNPKAIAFRKKLRQAGMMISTTEYRLVQTIVTVGSAALFGLIAWLLTTTIRISGFAAVFGMYFSYVVLRFSLAARITKRRESMRQQLPEVLDMLSVSVEAGLGLEQAILHVIDHFRGPLVDELNITYREMTMGRSRRDALLGLGDRCEVDEVKSFVRAINQASQLGISIKNVLRSQSAFIRQSRRNKIEEKAQKVSVKILLPMAFFIFPVMFIVLLGPAAIKISKLFL